MICNGSEQGLFDWVSQRALGRSGSVLAVCFQRRPNWLCVFAKSGKRCRAIRDVHL